MAFGHGKSAVVLMSGVRMDNYLNSLESTLTADTAETTVFNSSGYKSYLGGNKDATMSCEGLFSTTGIDSNLNTALGSTTPKVWTHWPQGTSTGSYGFGMQCYETTYDLNTPVDGVVSLSIEGQSKTGRDRVVSLFGLSSITATTGNGATNSGTSSALGGVGYIQRTDTGTRTLTGYIQHSSGSTFANLISFTASTGKSGARLAVSGAIKKNLRFKYNIAAGSTKPVTVNVGFNRK